jgi:type IV secretion system protein VirD4
LAIVNWLAAQLAWLLGTGHSLRRAVTASLAALFLLRRHAADPARAWTSGSTVRPAAAVYYASVALVVLAAVGLSLAALHTARRVRARNGSPKLGPGGGAATWATVGELRCLTVQRAGRRRRLVLGSVRALGIRRLVATEARHSVLVLGPTQSGKTSGLAIPALLEWEGPVLATSVKDDLARNTMHWRSRLGQVWLFDPSAASGLEPLSRWSPLALCSDWAGAQRVAAWLVDATPARTGMADAAFWYAAAAKQLAPLLLAAGVGGWSMAEVVRWTNTGDFDEPSQLLRIGAQDDAATALLACERRDDRIRSSVATTLETVLAPFEDPTVAAWTSGSEFELADLLDSSGTLYLCGPSHEQNRVQGVFSALVSSVIAAAAERVGRTGRTLDPPLLVVLDEAANIAPVHDLDTVASTCAGLGIQLVTVCQDLGQLSTRYGSERSRTIVNNHRAKLLLSGICDLPTLDLVSGLAGEEAVRDESYTVDQNDGRRTRSSAVAFRRLLPSDRLRRIPPGGGILIYGHLAPVQLRLRPWFRDPTLRRRATVCQV